MNHFSQPSKNITPWPCLALLLFSLALLAHPTPSPAYTIYLKSGQKLATDYCRQEGGQVYYEIYGGTVTMPLERVERLDCKGTGRSGPVVPSPSEDAPGPEGPAAGPGGPSAAAQQNDLAASLAASLAPATPLERANMATLAIESPLGAGSGFFVSADGYILTNKHVVKFSPEMREEMVREISRARQQLKEERTALALEQEGLNTAASRLRRDRASLARARAAGGAAADLAGLRRSVRLQEERLSAWRQGYAPRLKSFRKKQQHLQAAEKSMRRKNKEVSALRYYKIFLADGSSMSAQLIKVSQDHDLALLKVDGHLTPSLKAAEKRVPLGAPVYAIGNPVGRRNSISSGVLSARRDQFIQTNAEINPGNSGGPLVTARGEVIGINTKKLVDAKVEGMGFALAIHHALQEFADVLGSEQQRERK
ncbi:MAG: S1C family serine protease [Thermodesulfobacteriota bacterium]